MRPRLLDLYCGAGGSAAGYSAAGFDVVGVDHRPQKNYPFDFIQADAMEFLQTRATDGFDLIHASPPCQFYSQFSRNIGTAQRHPDLIAAIRQALMRSSRPYVIENVVGAPLISPVMLCGSMFGLRSGEMGLRRHRLFEVSFGLVLTPGCDHREKLSIGVYGNGTPQWHRKKLGRNIRTAEWAEAMGIDWMSRNELAQAIPPAYTYWLGQQLIPAIA